MSDRRDRERRAIARREGRAPADPNARPAGRPPRAAPAAAPEVPHARARLNQASEALERALEFVHPADKVLERYFKEHRGMGSKDRGACAEAVYSVLRHLRLYRHLVEAAGLDVEPRTLVGAWLLDAAGWSARALEEAGFTRDAAALVRAVRTTDRKALPFAVRHSLPDDLAELLIHQFGDDTEDVVRALNAQAPVDLRVNTYKTTREALRERLLATLGKDGVAVEPVPGAPAALRLSKRGALWSLPEFKQGLFEMQDAGSQRLAPLLDPQPGERVLDLCAGAGGKTLHLATLMRNSGQVFACDINEARLAKLSPRLARAGLSNIQMRAIEGVQDPMLRAQRGSFDAVLVDAPCSGLGTLRRNPDLKWRPLDLEGLRRTQRALLEEALRQIKPGGRVVYATCSLLDEENDAIVDAVAAATGAVVEERLHLLPHRDGTDGFFAARLRRAPA
jgi:16S rRNA (cytosine967-C5)-methyltransferase